MIEFINAVAPYVYWFLVVGSVFFGISIAVNFWLSKTINRIRKESNKNYNKYLSGIERDGVNFAISSAKINYSALVLQNATNEKIKRKNKFRKVFKLKEKPLKNDVKIKDVFTKLAKEVYKPFESINGEKREYLSFSKNEIFFIFNSLLARLDEIFSKSGIKWLKTVKLAVIANGVEIYSNYKSFFGKIWVIIVVNLINFFMWFLRIFSPVSVSKYFIKNLSSQNLSTLICDTLIEVIGKELAVIYKNGRLNSRNIQKITKTAV